MWELLSAGGQWLGNAFMDDDAIAGSKKTLTDVEYLVLTHDEESKDSQVLLIRKCETPEEYRRIGVAEILGLEVEVNLFDDQNVATIKLI